MANQVLTERATDFENFGSIKAAGRRLPFVPQDMAHIYVKLDFKFQFENASTSEDARGFLRSIARAAMAGSRIAQSYGGVLLEVQGSMMHLGLPRRQGVMESVERDRVNHLVGDLHAVYRTLFNDSKSRVEGWRMVADAGKTLVVAGRGVHGDESWVSLGKAANRPAKHLYEQLDIAEEHRHLKRFFIGARDPGTGQWHYQSLDRMPARLEEVKSIAGEVRQVEPKLNFIEAVSGSKLVNLSALPISPGGSPASPTPEKPHTYFGWVMRADLDGFTARVEECFDNDQKLQELAVEFYRIMDAAALFAQRHNETLAQLPWAGDNFTAAAVFSAKESYDAAVPRRLVELSLDFEKDMVESAIETGFGGWAHGIAGGNAHGNAIGNVFLAGIEIGSRRFLVGAGEGFGRTIQAFGEINPKSKQIVIYKTDWERLAEAYKKAFEPGIKPSGRPSTLYYIGNVEGLTRVRARLASVGTATTITFSGEQSQHVPTKPHSI